MKYRNLRFMGFPDYKVGTDGTVWSKKRGQWKKLKPSKKGPKGKTYYGVSLSNRGKVKNIYVHILVLRAFVGKCPYGHQSCHGIKGRFNNSIDNLCYGTISKNQKEDKTRDGTDNCGERCGRAKLTWKQVKKIRRLYRTVSKKTGLKWTQTRLAARFNVTQTNISSILTNRTFKIKEP